MTFAAPSAVAHGKRRAIVHWILHFGVGGVFIVAILDAAPVPLPIPGSTDILILIFGANGASPWLLAPIAIIGSLIGGYFSWAAGKKGGEKMVERYAPRRFHSHITRWVKAHGVLSVCLAALLPPPIPLLPFLLAAGALGVTRRQLFLALGIARVIRYGGEAALAALYGRRILRFWHQNLAAWSAVILWSFVGLMIAAIAFGIWKYRHDQKTSTPARSRKASPAHS